MNAAIYYHPEAYKTSGSKLMGRNAAGESFLRGFLLHGKAPEFWVQVAKPEYVKDFADLVKKLNRDERIRTIGPGNLGSLADVGVAFYPGPVIGEEAFHRVAFGDGAWSVCGITHTISSSFAMDAIANMLTSPVQPWDALICTSSAAKKSVETMLDAQAAYLSDRLGITKQVRPQLPVIPLGVHVNDFISTTDQKTNSRKLLGIDPEAIVVLYVGRLSFHAKAHPLAMYQALNIAAQKTGKKILLVECGQHHNEFIQKAYEEAFKLACPNIDLMYLDGRDRDNPKMAWASADIFCSLSDNIQETFGLTPIEAMAAGIPVVVSDWDGYKDTVRDGIDGFRIPTLMPQPGYGEDFALRHALFLDSFDMYSGFTSSLVAVDIQATAEAFIKLIQSPELRKQMGLAGQNRALANYDWGKIIPRYEELWSELNALRLSQAAHLKISQQSWPARMDPFRLFSSYPSTVLGPETILSLVDDDANQAIAKIESFRKLSMVDFAVMIIPSVEESKQILNAVRDSQMKAIDLVIGFPPMRQRHLLRSLVWLVKMGVLKVVK